MATFYLGSSVSLVPASRPSAMERTVIGSWDERLGLAFVMLGVRGRIRPTALASDCVEATSRLVTVEHQYGGYACLQEEVTGAIFRLPDAPARKDLRPLLGGLGSISERGVSPNDVVDRRLSAFGFTSGESLPPEAVSMIFSEYLPLPPFLEAWEAFAERVPASPAVLRGWPAWSEVGTARLDDELEDQLVAAAAITRQPLGLFLLWYNSD